MLQADSLNISMADIPIGQTSSVAQAVISCSEGLPAKPSLRLDTVTFCTSVGQRAKYDQFRGYYGPSDLPFVQ